MEWLTGWSGTSDAAQVFGAVLVTVMLLRLARSVLRVLGLAS